MQLPGKDRFDCLEIDAYAFTSHGPKQFIGKGHMCRMLTVAIDERWMTETHQPGVVILRIFLRRMASDCLSYTRNGTKYPPTLCNHSFYFLRGYPGYVVNDQVLYWSPGCALGQEFRSTIITSPQAHATLDFLADSPLYAGPVDKVAQPLAQTYGELALNPLHQCMPCAFRATMRSTWRWPLK